tara:strand:+ start:19 stop:318 length:300 start_codon:yes stop_codon:yes gene_type:complete
MTMVVDNNFKKFNDAIIIILPFQHFNDFYALLEKIYKNKYSVIFITDITNIKMLDNVYKNLSVPLYNYKIIIQLNRSSKQNIILNEKAKYKYIQIININ